MGASGKAIGKQYLDSVRDYLTRTPDLPVAADGGLNVTEIAERTGVPRQSFYKNPGIRAALEKARDARGIPARAPADQPPDAADGAGMPATDRAAKKTKTLERRVTLLEQQNAALVAENAELRRQLKALRLQHGREDMSINTGRRIPAPPTDRG